VIRHRAFAVSAVALLCAGAAALSAHAGPRAAPRNSLGQPDISGEWTNVSMTPETRAPGVTGAVFSPEQAKKIESAADAYAAEANKPSDPNEGAPPAGGDRVQPGTRSEFAAAAGGTGGYNYGWLDPGTRIMRVNGEPRTSILTTPDGRVPKGTSPEGLPPEYRNYQRRFENPEWMSLGERCIMSFGRNAGPPMLANGFYNNDYQIIQTADEVAIVVEMVHDVRHIRLNGTHRTDGLRPLMGDSIGRYEGDSLVVETTNIPEVQAYHGSWKTLTVTERFTPVGPGRLLYQFTIHDPTRWAADWGGEYEFHPMKGRLYEYACHEGNYALEHMLAGARADEAKAAAGKGG
jgi:hypothetical protein